LAKAFGGSSNTVGEDRSLASPKAWRSVSHSEIVNGIPAYPSPVNVVAGGRSYSVEPSNVAPNASPLPESVNSNTHVLQRVLKQQRAKTEASDPGLAPRGLMSDNTKTGANAPLMGGKKLDAEGTHQHGEYWQVNIGRWALRKSKLLAVESSKDAAFNDGGANKSISMVEHSSSAQKQIHSLSSGGNEISELGSVNSEMTSMSELTAVTATSATASTNHDQQSSVDKNSSSRVLGGLDGEIEYEIVIQEVHAWLWTSGNKQTAGGGFGSISAATPGQERGGSSQSAGLAQGGTARKWIIWRSSAEVFALHSHLLSVCGDLAPRKPHLRTAVKVCHSATCLRVVRLLILIHLPRRPHPRIPLCSQISRTI
jgi:hypothetical protein